MHRLILSAYEELINYDFVLDTSRDTFSIYTLGNLGYMKLYSFLLFILKVLSPCGKHYLSQISMYNTCVHVYVHVYYMYVCDCLSA